MFLSIGIRTGNLQPEKDIGRAIDRTYQIYLYLFYLSQFSIIQRSIKFVVIVIEITYKIVGQLSI